jgi:hypothetical protein
MKNLIILIIFGLLFVSCKSQEIVYLGNGKKVTQKQYDRYLMKIIRNSYKDLSKEDKNLLMSSTIHFEYEIK